MASKGKKISVLDDSGMLTQEALLGYVYGGLAPETHAEVEQLLAQNEMYADMAEGMRHIPTRAEAEKVLYELNADVATRSGSEASVPGIGENVSDFFRNYRRVAAVVGALLLLSAAVLTFALLQVSNGEGEVALKEEVPQQETTASTEQQNTIEPALAETPSSITGDTTVTIAALNANKDEDTFSEDEIAAALSTGSAVPGESAQNAQANEKRNKEAEKKKQAEVVAAQTTRADTVVNQNMALADEMEKDKSHERNEDVDLAKEEQAYQETVVAQSKKGTLSNTTTTTDSYYKNIPLTTAEQMPVFPGGDAAFVQYLHNNMKYPQKAKADGVEGKVYLRFTIGTTGKVKDIVIIQGVNKEMNAEAIRLIANMPKWEPGKQGGKPVAVQLNRTIEFKL